MKKFICLIFVCICTLIVNAQDADYAKKEQQTEAERRTQYKEVVTQIFKDDELFVLFYLDLALVVDPTKETQVVERITTENPWESLTGYIKGKSNIYFCPSSSQLSKAIEYMPCPIDLDILMSDKYGMYRLSSPEELFKNRGDSFRNSKHKAVVFGGLKYDEESIPITDNLLAFRGNREAMEGYQFLKSTYEEAIYIDSIFRRNGIETALLTGDDGTEQSFAQIPKHQVDIIHVASHGFYEPDKDNTESSSLQEWMMSHAGLVLAGAERETTNRSNDGRLTAYEISQTDLSGVNLVVLSACDTGLGDIKENDVYGLLKGFKKAGAGTLLVTLSEVNDTVTSLLMKRFYDNLFRGDNPRRALENAQRYIRLHGNGQFNKSEYWTPFVLVDDLDRNIGKNISQKDKDSFLFEIIKLEELYSETNLFPNWENIRKNINHDDIVLRIFPYNPQRDVEYVIMIGDVKTGTCVIKRLLYTEELQAIKKNIGMSVDTAMFKRIDVCLWNTVLPYLKTKKRIFVQTAGLFDNLPIEYSPLLSNKFDIYRISTLNILLKKEKMKSRYDNIALFGGLFYDSTKDKYTEELRSASYGLAFLPGTKMETDSIASVFKGKGIKLYQGYDGTEKAFRALNNAFEQLVHISTHAFSFNYKNDDVREVVKDMNLLNGIHSIEDFMLSHCGLCFSSANNAFLGNWKGPDYEDGIITGKDIARLCLNTVDLITLSACETGKNELGNTSSEVSWNMVKAFKLAGCNAVLASLWKVDDMSTCLLMMSFYNNLLAGKTKVAAIKDAQHYIRTFQKQYVIGNNIIITHPYSNPKYWASFVLIDAIE